MRYVEAEWGRDEENRREDEYSQGTYLHAQKCHNEHLYLVCLVYANKNSLSFLTRFSREQPE